MADILTEIDRLTDRLSLEFNNINVLRGDLTSLSTTQKTSLVEAINELKGNVDLIDDPSSIINDFSNTSTTEVWSILKTKGYADSLITGLFAGVPLRHDSILKISTEIDAILLDLDSKVSYDKDDTKTEVEKQQARDNIGAPSVDDVDQVTASVSTLSTNVGDTNFNFVTLFETNLT